MAYVLNHFTGTFDVVKDVTIGAPVIGGTATNFLRVAADGTLENVASSTFAAPTDATYVTLSVNATLTNERVLTGTANQIIVTDNGAGSTVVLTTPQNIHTAASPTFAGATLTGLTASRILFAGVGGLISGDAGLTYSTTAGLIVNESGLAAIDVRIEGDTNANLFFLDASADRIGIGVATPIAYLDITGGLNPTGTDPGGGGPQLAFNYAAGNGFRHFIRSRHNTAVVENAIDFYLNTSATVGGSSAPGTGNILALSIDADEGLGIFTDEPLGGGITLSRSYPGANLRFDVINSSNTASSAAWMVFSVGGALAADPVVIYDISGVQNWIHGVDNSDADKWKLSVGAGLGSGDLLIGTIGGFLGVGISPTSTLHAGGSFAAPVRTVTTTDTVLATDYTILCNSATAFTETLPTAVGITGRIYVIKNINTGAVTVDGSGAETIDGAATQILRNQYDSITIQSNGSNWFIL